MVAEKARAEPTVEQLWLRPDLNMSEAVRATGRSRETLQGWCDRGEVRWFQDGKSVRIVTASIHERSERLAAEQSGGGRW